MDIMNFISQHTVISAVTIVILYILVRFYLWPKIRGDLPKEKKENPFDTNKYDNTKEMK